MYRRRAAAVVGGAAVAPHATLAGRRRAADQALCKDPITLPRRLVQLPTCTLEALGALDRFKGGSVFARLRRLGVEAHALQVGGHRLILGVDRVAEVACFEAR